MNEFGCLIKEFNRIHRMRYIKGVNNLSNSAGLTFESLLGKLPDSKYLPDYHNIEIKTTLRYSRYDISLFSISFTGPEVYESNYLLHEYGKYDNNYNKYSLILNLKVNEKVFYNNYYFELKIDYFKRLLYINIYDINHILIEKRGFIFFNNLNNRIDTKLNNLALIFASKKKINNELFFRFYKIICYKYKGFNTFLALLKDGTIKVTLMLRFAKSNIIGENKNKNMIFKISKNNINKLYETVYEYNE